MLNNACINLAYIDPHSGTLFVQFVIASLVGGLAFFHHQVIGVCIWFRSKIPSRRN